MKWNMIIFHCYSSHAYQQYFLCKLIRMECITCLDELMEYQLIMSYVSVSMHCMHTAIHLWMAWGFTQLRQHLAFFPEMLFTTIPLLNQTYQATPTMLSRVHIHVHRSQFETQSLGLTLGMQLTHWRSEWLKLYQWEWSMPIKHARQPCMCISSLRRMFVFLIY